MKKFLIITILTLSTTMASAKPADALPFLAVPLYSAGSAVVSWVVPTMSFKGIASYFTLRSGVKYVTHSSGKQIGKKANKYVAGTIR